MDKVLERVLEWGCEGSSLPSLQRESLSCCQSFWMCRTFLVEAAVPETALYLDLLKNNQEFIV